MQLVQFSIMLSFLGDGKTLRSLRYFMYNYDTILQPKCALYDTY